MYSVHEFIHREELIWTRYCHFVVIHSLIHPGNKHNLFVFNLIYKIVWILLVVPSLFHWLKPKFLASFWRLEQKKRSYFNLFSIKESIFNAYTESSWINNSCLSRRMLSFIQINKSLIFPKIKNHINTIVFGFLHYHLHVLFSSSSIFRDLILSNRFSAPPL